MYTFTKCRGKHGGRFSNHLPRFRAAFRLVVQDYNTQSVITRVLARESSVPRLFFLGGAGGGGQGEESLKE